MFFALSKTLGQMVEPVTLSLVAIGSALLLGRLRRCPRVRRFCWIIGVGVLLVFSSGAVANALLFPLEQAYSRPTKLARPPAAIVMLGGTLDVEAPSPSYFELTASADRFVEAARLARRYPSAILVISGGSSTLVRRTRKEAPVLGRLARELGIDPRRIRLDERSRNTRENAVYSMKLLADVQGPVLLVTSASHMLRAVACFARAGRKVVPWPVDYQRENLATLRAWLPHPAAMDRSTAALREYMGLLAYRLAGYL